MQGQTVAAALTDEKPVESVTFIRTGDPVVDLITLITRYLNQYHCNTRSSALALEFAAKRQHLQADWEQEQQKNYTVPNPQYMPADEVAKMKAQLMGQIANSKTSAQWQADLCNKVANLTGDPRMAAKLYPEPHPESQQDYLGR